MAYKALRNLSAGRDKNGKLITFEKGKTYDEVPENVQPYFEKVEKAKASK